MVQLPVVQYHTIDEAVARNELEMAISAITIELDKGETTKILNAFLAGTRIRVNGMPYLKVKELAQILRTGNYGAHRILVYNGIPQVVNAAVLVEIEGEEYISGPSMLALVEARISFTSGKTKQYLNLVKEMYDRIKNSEYVRDLKEVFLQAINEKRSSLKAARINKYSITQCEFSGLLFGDASKVEFAHIESVVTNPNLALDIDNGVIILKDIHSQLTKLGIHDSTGMYNFCRGKNYSTSWRI